ncbi:MAG: PAS domain S-box protein, partial [Candidatus Acidiferrales bacterium]
FRSTPDAMSISRQRDGVLIEVNEAFERLSGYRRGEVLGKTPIELNLWDDPGERGRLMPRLLREGRLAEQEVRFRSRGGELRICLVSAEMITLGAEPCILTIARDISDSKRAEEALRESEERYRLLFESNPHPMWVFDRGSYRFLAVNQAAVDQYGYSRQEFLGMTIADIRPEEDVPRLMDRLAHPANHLEKAGTWRHRKKDGSLIDVEITTHPIQFAGRPAEIVLANDITERRTLEEQLRQSQKMEAVGRLAGGIAHDFNNLLMVIAGHGELLHDKLPKESPLLRHADEIRQTADRATALTRQLLAFSRRQVLQPRVLDLNSVVGDMESMLGRLIGEDIELVTRLNPELGRVKADPSQLEQVLMNLVVNARDAMPEGGKLTLVTDNVQLDEAYSNAHVAVKPGEYVMLAVSDTGRGMEKEILAHAFEPFFTTKEKGKGTGLGLATAYGIVKQSGGNIWVYSEPGHGTTFKVYLPRVGQGAEPAVLPAPRRESGKVRDKLNVLLVEDEAPLRLLVRSFLESSGHNVLEAGSGEEALRIAAESKQPIHLLMTDVVMPGITGRVLADQLAGRHPGMKVLFMSGYTEDAIVHHGVLEAGLAFLQKPFTITALAQKMKEVMGS